MQCPVACCRALLSQLALAKQRTSMKFIPPMRPGLSKGACARSLRWRWSKTPLAVILYGSLFAEKNCKAKLDTNQFKPPTERYGFLTTQGVAPIHPRL